MGKLARAATSAPRDGETDAGSEGRVLTGAVTPVIATAADGVSDDDETPGDTPTDACGGGVPDGEATPAGEAFAAEEESTESGGVLVAPGGGTTDPADGMTSGVRPDRGLDMAPPGGVGFADDAVTFVVELEE